MTFVVWYAIFGFIETRNKGDYMGILTRRGFLKVAGVFSLMPACFKASAAPDQKLPNIVFILADDLGLMDSDLYGSKYYETPNLRRLAKRGMMFTNAYAASPLCSPTRASILTGKYPARLRITTPACHLPPLDPTQPLLAKKASPNHKMVTPQSRRFLPLEEYTFAEAFEDAGYKTSFIGKWHLGLEEKYWPKNQGFQYDLGAPNPGPPSYFSPYRFKTIPDGPEGEYITDRITDEAVKYLDNHKDGPFMLCHWHFAVHAPFQAKEDITKKYRNRKDPRGKQDCPVMASMIQSMDESVGRVIDKIDSLGIADNTIIIFMSDNGGNMYNEVEGTTPTNNYPLRGGKGNSYEGGTREPCIIVWPKVVIPNTRCDEIITSTDFYPTMLEMVGIKPRKDNALDGVSIVPLLKGKSKLSREAIFCHFPHYVPATNNLPCTYVRKGEWKLMRIYGEGPDRTNAYELYNLKDDVGEQNNLAKTMPSKVKELDHLIDQFLEDTDAIIPVKNPAYRDSLKGWFNNHCELDNYQRPRKLESTGGDPYIYCSDLPIISGSLAFEFKMQSELKGEGLFFWTDSKVKNFSRNQRIEFEVFRDNNFHEYRIPFTPEGTLKSIRLDPGNEKGKVQFEYIRLVRKNGDVLKSW